MNLINKSYAFLKMGLNTALDFSRDRIVLIATLNKLLKEEYVNGMTNRLVIASIESGDRHYKHSMSAHWLRSGFMLTIQNDNALTAVEAKSVAFYILENNIFVRQLIVLGFDTLIVRGKNTHALKFELTENDTTPKFLK